jgi:hypothetical protein
MGTRGGGGGLGHQRSCREDHAEELQGPPPPDAMLQTGAAASWEGSDGPGTVRE